MYALEYFHHIIIFLLSTIDIFVLYDQQRQPVAFHQPRTPPTIRSVLMLYNFLKTIVLLINALVIINERFLRQIGFAPNQPAPSTDLVQPSPQQTGSFFTVMTDQNVKAVVHYPLIAINIVFILLESLLG